MAIRASTPMSKSPTHHPSVNYLPEEGGAIVKLEHVPNYTYGNVGSGDLGESVLRGRSVD